MKYLNAQPHVPHLTNSGDGNVPCKILAQMLGSQLGLATLMSAFSSFDSLLFHFHLHGVRAILALAIVVALGSAAVAGTIRPPNVSSTAEQLVERVHGTFVAEPSNVPQQKLPGSPVLGNGDMGVVLQGPASKLRFYVDKSDFFGVIRGYIVPMGSLEFTIPSLRHASYHAQQNVGPATVTGRFVSSAGAALAMRSWVANGEDLLVVKMRNTGNQALEVTSRLLDAWSTPGHKPILSPKGQLELAARLDSVPAARPLRGAADGEVWLHVSPDMVEATVGNQIKQGHPAAFDGLIGAVTIARRAVTPAAKHPGHPMMAWPNAAGVALHGVKLVRKRPHGWAVALSGAPTAYASLGMLRLPQHAFTLSLWVLADAAGKRNVIFAAQPGNFWPFGPKNYAGFSLELVNGRLRATLNRTVAQASKTFPLDHWTKVTVTYDARAMTLYEDGQAVARTTDFPTAAQVMGADKYSIHTGVRGVPFENCSPKGVLMERVLGVKTSVSDARETFTINPGEAATVLLMGTDNRDSGLYFPKTRKRLASLTEPGIARDYQKHLIWWRHFWGKSFVRLPDQQVQAAWYGSLYLLACCSSPNHVAPGLWGNFVTTPHPAWQGDYTLDYNYEAQFWGAFAANHVELTGNYDRILLDYMPRGAAEAKVAGYSGLYDYTHLIPLPGWDADPSQHMKMKSATLFAAMDCIMRWRYTHDLGYARKIYPFLLGVAEFWDHYLKLKHGVYNDQEDAPFENQGAHAVNPANSVAFLHLFYANLVVISKALHRNAHLRTKWQVICNHLSPLPVVRGDTLKPLIGKLRRKESGSEWVIARATGGVPPDIVHTLWSVWPGWQIGLESSAKLRQAGLNTARLLQHWSSGNFTSTFYPAAAAVRYPPQSLLKHLHILVARYMRPNFTLPFGGGGVENFTDVPAGIDAMLLQSFQKQIHIFPDWPMDKNVQFGNLLACGDFLVSSQVKNGRVPYVQITSEEGLGLRLANPWQGQRVKYTTRPGNQATLAGDVLSLPTQPGEVITFRPGQ